MSSVIHGELGDDDDELEYDDEEDFLHELEQVPNDDSDEDPNFSDPESPSTARKSPPVINDDDLDSLDGDRLDEEAENAEAEAVINDEEMESFHHDLQAAHGFKNGLRARRGKGGRRGGRRARGDENLSFEVRGLMGQANQAFAFGYLDNAMAVVKRVIQIEPNAYSAWKLLGEIFREKGEEHKCLLAWLTAAHAMPKDWELWLTCATMSLQQYGPDKRNYRDQAIYCYSRAIRGNPDNIDLVLDRSALLKEAGQLYKAAEGYLALYRLLPHDPMVLREIATVYMEMDKVPEAIELYERAVEHHRANGNENTAFDWSALNILAELYMMQRQWMKAISTIKKLGRWLSGRSDDSYWEKWKDDDREWDAGPERRVYVMEYESAKFAPESYTLPIELRVKLGISRLKLENQKEAMAHFAFLEHASPQEYADMYQEVAEALSAAGLYEDALHYFTAVTDEATHLDRKLWFNTATCYRNLNRVDEAGEIYSTVLEAYPDDTEAMIQLAGLYEASDRKAEALDLLNEFIRLKRKKEAAERGEASTQAVSGAVVDDRASLLPNQPVPLKTGKRRKKIALTAEERAEMEAKKTEQVEVKFRKLQYIFDMMESGDPTAVKDWLDTAGDLVDQFRNTRALYPSERSHVYRGFVATAGRRAGAQSDSVQLEKMQNRLQESLTFEEEQIDDPEKLIKFRGLDFDQWLYIFCQYAVCLTKYDNYQDAYDVCAAAKESTVFYHDKRKTFVIWATWLACAIYVGDSESCSTIARWFMTTYQFQTETYALFTAACTMSRNGLEVFHNNANQKYLLRQIKTMDQYITGEPRVGAAGLTGVDENGNEFVPTEIDVGLLMLYGHILASGKSYISALNYYSRVYTVAPKHPMVLFCIALAYLHRSMTRQSENRQTQILQAMTFLFEYYETRTAEGEGEGLPEVQKMERLQEAEFNVARAFHHLGLAHLAVPYYNKVLEISDTWGTKIKGDLKWEAAYNLQMIYVTSGNGALAREVTDKYLVI